MRLPRGLNSARSLLLVSGYAHGWAEVSGRALRAMCAGMLPAMFLLRTSTREEIYNILWALVFGFATLNIVTLGARRFEQQKTGLNFGEILAVLVVIVSLVMLGWEMLYLFGILPLQFTPR
jgi:hypothetical protein